MKTSRNKAMATTITMILVSSMFLTLFAIPTANAGQDSATSAAVAAGMKWDFPFTSAALPEAANSNASATRLLIWTRYKDKVPTRTYNVPAPNPVGVGQAFTVVFFQPIVPPDALLTNDIRYDYYNTITKPDGQVGRLPASGTVKSDS